MTTALPIKTWRMNEKEISISYQDGKYEFQINDGENFSIIPLQNIEGIPFEKLNEPDSVKKFLKDTYIKLHTVPNEEKQFKLYIFQGLAGGANIIDPNSEPEKLWPKGIIPFEIDTRTYPVTEEGRAMIMNAIEEWNNSGTGFMLVPRIDQKDYLVFGEAENACYSNVGRVRGRQYVRCDLNSGGFNTSSVLHEIGHTIGFYHEHQRSDRSEYVKVTSSNRNDYGIEGNPYGKYDFDSIMHYYFDRDMKPKRQLSYPDLVGRVEHLSEGDIAAAKHLYQKSLNGNVAANNPQTASLSGNSASLFTQTRQPPVWKILRTKADRYFEQESYSNAFTYYTALLNEYGPVMNKLLTSDIYTQLGKCCYELNCSAEAYKFFSKAIEFNSNNKTAEEYRDELAPVNCSTESCRII